MRADRVVRPTPPRTGSRGWPPAAGRALVALVCAIGGLTWGCDLTAQEPVIEGAPELVAQLGHSGPIEWAAISPGGRYGATSSDGSVRLWELQSGRELRSYRPGAPAPVLFSPDGRWLLVASVDGTLHLHGVERASETRALRGGHTRPPIAAAFSADGRFLVTAQSARDPKHNYAIVWRLGDGMIVRHLPLEVAQARGVAIAPDGSTIALATRSGGVRIWSDDDSGWDQAIPLATIELEWSFEVAFAADNRLLTSTPSGRVDVWEIDGTHVRRLAPGLADDALLPGLWQNLAVDANGQLAWIVGPEDVRAVDVATGDLVRTLASPTPLAALAIAADGSSVLAGSTTGSAYVWRIAGTGPDLPGDPHLRLARRAVAARSMAIQDAGLLIAVGASAADGGGAAPRTVLWNDEPAPRNRSFEGWSAITAMAVDPTSDQVAVSAYDGEVVVLGPDGEPRLRLDSSPSRGRREGGPEALAFTHDGEVLLAGGDGFNLGPLAWSTVTGERLRLLDTSALAADDDFGPWVDFDDHLVAAAADAPVVLTAGTVVHAWDSSSGALLFESEPHDGYADPSDSLPDNQAMAVWSIGALAVSSDGRFGAAARAGEILVYYLPARAILQRLVGDSSFVRSLAFSPSGDFLASGSEDGTARLWDVRRGIEVRRLDGHSGPLNDVLLFGYDPEQQRLDGDVREDLPEHWDRMAMITASDDGTTRFWRLRDEAEIMRLIHFTDGTWAVVDPRGRYDASLAGEVAGLHWVAGNEPIALSQLKDRYWEPELFSKLLGLHDEPLRDVDSFRDVELYPEVTVTAGSRRGSIRIELRNRGGGIGPVQVKVAGKEVFADARPPDFDPQAARATLEVDLAGSGVLAPGRDNPVEVVARNAAGYLASRGAAAVVHGDEGILPEPTLWIVAAGVSDYRGDELDLRFAGRDAAAFAEVIALGGSRLFDERVRASVLSTEGDGQPAPTRVALIEALRAARASGPDDVLVVYLAGHGVIHGGPDGDYYYLTSDARSADLADPVVRESVALSSEELTELLAAIPARKQLLVLDTCAAGRVVEQLVEKRDVPASQVRALERMKDRAGLFVLAGSAADAVSYEASRYGQGLLTYALLQGLRGEALRDDGFIDVATLLNHAVDRVPLLARGLGGIQAPELRAPRRGSFDIGMLPAADRLAIELEDPLPVLVRSSFQSADNPSDPLRLTAAVHALLRENAATERPRMAFVDANEYPDAFRVGGRYRVDGDAVVVDWTLYLADEEVLRAQLHGSPASVDALAGALVDALLEQLR